MMNDRHTLYTQHWCNDWHTVYFVTWICSLIVVCFVCRFRWEISKHSTPKMATLFLNVSPAKPPNITHCLSQFHPTPSCAVSLHEQSLSTVLNFSIANHLKHTSIYGWFLYYITSDYFRDMVKVMIAVVTCRVVAHVNWLSLKFVSFLAMFFIHQINCDNSKCCCTLLPF